MIQIIPDTTTVIEASQLAAAAHLHLITNGKRTVLSPVIPKGWTKISVSFPSTSRASKGILHG